MSLAEEVPKALGLRVGLGIPLAVFNLTHTRVMQRHTGGNTDNTTQTYSECKMYK